MAHRVLCRNSLLAFLFITIAACEYRPATVTVTVPEVYVQQHDTALRQQEGKLYYHQKKFSGRIYALYPNGDTAVLFFYSNGREEGSSQQWYEGKIRKEERFYTAGRKEGRHRGWWPNGAPRFLYQFQNDEHEGEAKEWYPDGKPARSFTYVKGKEAGRQQMWWEDGKLRANYVVKNGQQYGLIGRKLCINEDSNLAR